MKNIKTNPILNILYNDKSGCKMGYCFNGITNMMFTMKLCLFKPAVLHLTCAHSLSFTCSLIFPVKCLSCTTNVKTLDCGQKMNAYTILHPI